MANVTAAPFVLVKPKISLGTGGTAVEIQCGAQQLTIEPDQDENTVETFCGIFTTYKPENWTITVGALQSFGSAGLWTNVHPLCGTVQPFTILPDSTAITSVSNPTMTGNAFVKGMPFLSASVGEASEFDLELAVQGIPTFAIT